MNWKHIILFCFLLFSAGAAKTQHLLVLQKLNEWNDAAPVLSTEKFQEEIRKTVTKIYGQSDNCTNSAVTIDNVHPATADRYVFGALIRQQMRNAWTVITRLPGCDNVPVRFMVMQRADKSLKTIRVNRGSSYAHDSLIGDTLPLAVLAATNALKQAGDVCNVDDKFKLGVTRIESEEDGLGPDLFGVRYQGSWQEVWPITICNSTVEVLIQFTADGDGGAYQRLPGDKVKILTK